MFLRLSQEVRDVSHRCPPVLVDAATIGQPLAWCVTVFVDGHKQPAHTDR